MKYSESYIDRIFEEKDLLKLHQTVSLLEEDNVEVGDKLWLACRLFEWAGSMRSGVWQWYEGVNPNTSNRILTLLKKFDLGQFAIKYEFGIMHWEDEVKIEELDNWLIDNELDIEKNIWDLIINEKNYLKKITR